MVYSDAQTYLEALFQTRWAAADVQFNVDGIPLKAPTQFENVPFDDLGYEYVYRLMLIFGPVKNIGLGGVCKRYVNTLQVSIFHKPGSGEVVALRACDDIVNFFTNKSFSIYEFTEASVRKLPKDTLGWVQKIVSCPFSFDIRS